MRRTPMFAGALACAASAAVSLGAVADRGLDVLRGSPDLTGFSLATQPREFEFPRDHGPHPDFRHEWWYLTGNLTSPAGERFGFELTFFRIALTPAPAPAPAPASAPALAPTVARPTGAAPTVAAPTVAAPTAASTTSSPWRTRQIYVAHFAITDVSRGVFRFAQKYERDALGLSGAAAEPFHVWLDDWQMGGGPRWSVHAQQQDYELNLEVQALTAPILNGDGGLSVKSSQAGAASYYYSIPRVTVRGQITRERTPVPVTGIAWLDREWGSGSLGSTEAGWDWFALQLDDGSALMFYALRNQDGSREPHSAGTWVDAAGSAHPLSSHDVEIEVGAHWTSPRGGRYPSQWRVRVPSLAFDVDVKPVLPDQELGTKPNYWEGAVDVSGVHSGNKTAGRGYVELVGYAGEAATREVLR